MVQQRLITLGEACSHFGVSRKTLLRWRTAGVEGNKLDSIRIGRHVRIEPAELERFLSELPRGVGRCDAKRSA
jgi:excisionase family DNA binding protein